VKTMTDGKGSTATFTYDPLNRITQISYSDGGYVTYTYDLDGNLTARKDDANGTVNYTWDSMNRLTKETPPPPRAVDTYTYDLTSNIATVGDDGGTTTYAYDAVNMVTSVTDPNGAKTTFSYDDPRDTFRTKTVYPNGVTMQVTPDGSSRIKEIKATKGATTLTSFTYTYLAGTKDTALRQSVTDKAGVTTTYTYDPVNRLTKADASTGTDYAYGYDPNSNLTSKTIDASITNLTYNAANELTSSGGTTYTYDGAGNLTGSSAGLSASYNAKNQTTSITPPGGAAVPMGYQDADQTKRISRGDLNFDDNVLGLSVEWSKGGKSSSTFYTRDNLGTLVSERAPAGSYYYLFDGLGSVVGLTDASGNQVASYTYEPYGKQTSAEPAVANPWRFAAGYFDSPTGLTKFGTRYYDSNVMRWTQQDPERGDLSDPITLNPYAYVAGNPVNLTDPTGEFFMVIIAAVVIVSLTAPIIMNVAAGAKATYANDPAARRSALDLQRRTAPYLSWNVQAKSGGPPVPPYRLPPPEWYRAPWYPV
jgi:RHS repeat-associated protein